MPIVVQKYGGSSVADVERLGKVADKVAATRRAGEDVVVVVSAMGKTTDQLLALAHAVDESPPRRELDMLLTTGERVSMALLSMAIQKRGLDAISFTGSQSGIITNDRHFDARIIEVRPFRIEDELARGRVVIIAGYQGMSYRREITTLGRGGSDTTAIALAAALGAERAEIYSDVDGVYSADPRVVPDAQHLPELDYARMQEMSDVGAKVLNASAVEMARAAKIRIHARATFSPGRETVVSEAPSAIAPPSVVGQRGVVRVHVGGHAALRKATTIAAAGAVPARDASVTNEGGTFLLASGLTPDWPALRARLVAEVEGLRLEEGLACASVIGADGALLARAIDASAGHEVLAWSAAGGRASALVREASVDDVVRDLHRHFVEAPPAEARGA